MPEIIGKAGSHDRLPALFLIAQMHQYGIGVRIQIRDKPQS